MKNVPNYATLKISILSATNTKGTRIKIIDLNNLGIKIILPFDYFYKDIADQAEQYLMDNFIKIHGFSSCNGFYLFLVSYSSLESRFLIKN
jgi:hypothetical protein